MPYIKQEQRTSFPYDPYDLGAHARYSAGELNYAVSRMLTGYLGNDASYSDFNETLGVLEAAKLELYRRMIAPYEDKKIKENGDVY